MSNQSREEAKVELAVGMAGAVGQTFRKLQPFDKDQWLKRADWCIEVVERHGIVTWPKPAGLSSQKCPHCGWGFHPSVIKQHIAEKH